MKAVAASWRIENEKVGPSMSIRAADESASPVTGSLKAIVCTCRLPRAWDHPDRFSARGWDHLVASDGTTRRVARIVLITSGTGSAALGLLQAVAAAQVDHGCGRRALVGDWSRTPRSRLSQAESHSSSLFIGEPPRMPASVGAA